MNYLLRFVIFGAITLASIGSFNWLVDPYGLYWSPTIHGFNAKKTESSERGRQTKGYRLTAIRPQVLIMGNSRVEMGLSTEHPTFSNRRVYNSGIPGLSLDQQYARTIEQINQNPELKEVYLSLDFLDFLYMDPSVDDGWHPSVAGEFRAINFIFSLDTLTNSVSTIINQQKLANYIDRHGVHIPESYQAILSTEGIRPLFTQKLGSISHQLSNRPLKISADGKHNQGIAMLQYVIDAANAKNITIHLFTNPYHYSYLHTLKDAGYWQKFIEWKILLAHLANKNHLIITDFSGFNKYSLENVDLQQPHKAMNWFWEPAHYRAELGDLMLDELNELAQHGIGRKLSEESIANIITEDNQNVTKSMERWQKLKQALLL
ncbi:hypothetical protein [Bowmanella sp. JS7-9]|uniref:SGNH/GDSL hydrolase family protein n=1 Tax=Pseudobowmanella zhangzhouensis TaxID=1537679 RepID=A0ABW1XGU6_9ALTE|nr:hypothetical protein [Bowmanella sp. JS7-9]TBX20859.1 hypothetical protein TK45_13875 [Bowmanella sp. JS7-9]